MKKRQPRANGDEDDRHEVMPLDRECVSTDVFPLKVDRNRGNCGYWRNRAKRARHIARSRIKARIISPLCRAPSIALGSASGRLRDSSNKFSPPRLPQYETLFCLIFITSRRHKLNLDQSEGGVPPRPLSESRQMAR